MLVSRLPEVVFWNPWLDAYCHWVKIFCDAEPVYKRGYIQHPSEIPLRIDPIAAVSAVPSSEVPTKGLCFESQQLLPVGSDVKITITLNGTDFAGDAKVVWVDENQGHPIVGVNFSDKKTAYGIRMAEQICHIEHYRKEVLENQGRALTEEEAASEWVERYASDFPAVF